MKEDWNFTWFKEKFYKLSGLNLDSYKERQMERRVRQFMEREAQGSFSVFYALLQKDRLIYRKFLNYLTINTSGFFRDIKIYDYLQKIVLPGLLHEKESINIWSMGCSRGEEPYTIAIILKEMQCLERASIMASDIDDQVCKAAREVVFLPGQIDRVPKPLLKKYFSYDEGYYHLQDGIKSAVTFKKHNLLGPVYRQMQPMHLVLCRNVFIYLKAEVQDVIIENAVSLIIPGGFFIVGCAEFVKNPQRFGLVRKISSIYQKE